MAEGSDNTYAPQSPDLSSFFSTTTTSSSIAPNSSAPTSAFPHNTRTASSASPAAFPGQHHLLPSSASSLTSSYTPRSPVLPATFAVPHDPHHQPQQSHHHQPPPPQHYVQFAPHLGHQQQQQQQQQLQPQYPQHQPYPQAALSPGGPNYYVPPLPQSHAAPSPGPSFQHHPQALVPTSIYPSQHQQSYSGGYPSSGQAIGGSGGLAQQYPDYDNMPGRPRGSRNVKVEEAVFDVNGANFGQSQFQAQAPIAMPQGPGPSQGIEVRTKFPVARIKRIMQADEEVGKVAQVTPVAVSKALELFMISLVMRSADVAKAKSSKRITAHHLKQAIEADEQFDFLNEIVAKVGDAPEPKKERERVKSDEDSDDLGAAKKKRGGRRKKSEE